SAARLPAPATRLRSRSGPPVPAPTSCSRSPRSMRCTAVAQILGANARHCCLRQALDGTASAMGVAARLREIWYEECHAPLYLVQRPGRLDTTGDGSGWTEHMDAGGIVRRAIALRSGERFRYHLGVPPRGTFHAWLAGSGSNGTIEYRLVARTTDGRRDEW